MWQSILILGLLSSFLGSISGGNFITSLPSGNVFYVEKNLKVDWYEALRICLSQNMSLITPDTEEKNRELTELISDLDVQEHVWTSGQEVDNHLYAWITTGENINWTNWRLGEPARQNVEKTQCIGYYFDGWASYTCTQPTNFICEQNSFLENTIENVKSKCHTRNQDIGNNESNMQSYNLKLQQKENEKMQSQLMLAEQRLECKSKEIAMLRELYQKEIQLLEEKINLVGKLKET